jgi:hypothetical protein
MLAGLFYIRDGRTGLILLIPEEAGVRWDEASAIQRGKVPPR